MRKLTFLMAAMGLTALLCGCSKHNASSSNYYFSFQSGAIQYTTAVDSQVQVHVYSYPTYGLISMMGLRTIAQTDSAEAGFIELATWNFDLDNRNVGPASFAGDYTTDTSGSSSRWVETNTDFRFYSAIDPHKGQYIPSAGLPFTVTITQWGTTWFEGTFSGQVIQNNPSTGETDTVTITNGKFRLPVPQ
jgi:hypothetical protein